MDEQSPGLSPARRTQSAFNPSARKVLLGRLSDYRDGTLRFDDDLEENIRFADQSSENVKREIDAFIDRAGIDAPPAEPDAAETVAPRLPNPPVRELDAVAAGIRTIIWCTGFKGDFSWVRIDGALDGKGQPLQVEGLSAVPGLYFPGLAFSKSRRSGTILAIAEEASRMAQLVAARSVR